MRALRFFPPIFAAALIAGCATTTPQSAPQSDQHSDSQSESHSDSHSDSTHTDDAQESAVAAQRLALTYDGGILVVDADTLAEVATIPLAGFNRIEAAADGRHIMVSTAGKFQAMDMGTWGDAHGDHFHYFTAQPQLTDTAFPAQTPGHVVANAEKTALFDDGTGTVQVVDPEFEVLETYQSAHPHHGVAVALEDDTLLVSTGDDKSRDGAVALDHHQKVIAESRECPGLHGVAAGHDSAVFGCADGALIYHDGTFRKLASPDQAGKMGSLRGSPESPIVLADYSTSKESATTHIALIDPDTSAIKVVDLGTEYSFRSLARGDHGEAIILGQDGKLHILDPQTGSEIRQVPVIDAWVAPTEWQEPRPAVFVQDGTAFVVDPATTKIYAIDVETGEIWNQATLSQVTNEITGVTGVGVSSAHHDHDDHEDHDH